MTECSASSFLNVLQPGKFKNDPLPWDGKINRCGKDKRWHLNRRYLLAAGVRIPTLEFPWSLTEFGDALAKLADLKEVDYPINFFIPVRHHEFYPARRSALAQSPLSGPIRKVFT